MVSDADGRAAVAWARRSIGARLSRPAGREAAPSSAGESAPPPLFSERRGVFVTLSRAKDGELRGCIGFPLPHLPLGEAIGRAGVAAATEDPRFPPVDADEFGHLLVEVSILSVPAPLHVEPREAMPEAIVVGQDGLIVEGWGTSGLLLPQVAPEWGFDARQFLDATCEKAGLPPDAWLDPRARVLSFSAEVFREASPAAPAERVVLTPEAKPSARGGRRR